jgi:hypothetical protein
MLNLIKRLLALVGLGRRDRPRGPQADPHAWKPAPRRPRLNDRAAAVALAEPDE